MNWIMPSISIDCGFKFAIALTLFIRFIETKDKVIFWWSVGWLFFGLHNIIELILILTEIEWLWFPRHIFYAFTAVAFLESIGCMQKPTPKTWHIISIFIGIIAIISSYIGVFVVKEWYSASIPSSLINGIGFITCSFFFLKLTEKKRIANILIFFGFFLNGIHNLDYPFLRPVTWFAPIGFSLGVLFSFIFAVGLVVSTTAKLQYQKAESQKAAKNLSILNAISRTINQSRSLNETIKNVIDKIVELMNVDIVFMILLQEPACNFNLVDYRGFDQKSEEILKSINFSKDILLRNIMQLKNIKSINNISEEKTLLKTVLKTEKVLSFIGIPLISKDKILGLLNIAYRNFHEINEDEVKLLNFISNDIGVSIENIILYEKVKNWSNELTKIVEGRTKELTDARKATLNILEDLNESYEKLKITQNKLIQSEKLAAIGQMAASVSHEIKNPLTGIKTSNYYLASIIKNPSSQVGATIKNIDKEIEYMSKIITDILNYSKLIKLELKSTNINIIIEEAIDAFTEKELLKKIKLYRKLDQALPEILIDRIRFIQMINNLILNACQAMKKNGKLTIKTSASNNKVEIRIIDNGIGIEKNNLDSIFEPFFTSKHRGIGLGLSIVREIVNSHNGSIKVESEVKKGSSFIIKLPIK